MSLRKAAPVAVLVLAALVLGAPAFAAPKDRTAPKAPTNLRITAMTTTSVTLAWNASSDNSSSWWYCVQRSGAGCFRVDPPKTTFVYPLLQPATSYSFSVVALDQAGNRSGASNTVTFTTPPDTTAPSAPVLSLTAVFPTRISVSWTKSVDDMGGQVSTTLFVDGAPYFGTFLGFQGLMIPYLQPSSTHTFKVVAKDRSGNTAESNVLTVTTPPANDAVPPSAPSNLMFSSETSAPEIWLDWTAATDNLDPQAQLLYEVWVNGTLASTGLGNVEDIVYCVDTGVNTIAVRALDTSGNASAFSNTIVFVC
jgi:chitodextrinase